MATVQIAIIGCGNIARKHIACITELGEEAAVAALCDIDRQRMERFAEETGLSDNPKLRYYTRVEELWKDGGIDLAVIATSSDTHSPLAIQALRAGKHVLAEKPLALSVHEARAVASEAQRSGRMMAVALQARYMPQMKAIKRAVEQGRFGKLIHGAVSVRWNRNMEYYTASPWRDSWLKGGGLFMNQCIHYIDLLQWLMGPVQSVYGHAGAFGQPLHVENMGAAVLKFASGTIGIVEASACIYPRTLSTSISLFGEKGSVSLEGERLNELKLWQFEDALPEDAVLRDTPGLLSHTPLYQDLIHSIRTGVPPMVSVEASLDSIEIVLAIYKSISEKKEVRLPLNEFDMNEATLKNGWSEAQ